MDRPKCTALRAYEQPCSFGIPGYLAAGEPPLGETTTAYSSLQSADDATIAGTLAECPSIDFDALALNFVQDPHDVMEEWRRITPVVYNSGHNQHLATPHRNCTRIGCRCALQFRQSAAANGEPLWAARASSPSIRHETESFA